MIPSLLVLFTWQLEILVTTLSQPQRSPKIFHFQFRGYGLEAVYFILWVKSVLNRDGGAYFQGGGGGVKTSIGGMSLQGCLGASPR